jgi:Ca2+-binding RTX toxin-like protein
VNDIVVEEGDEGHDMVRASVSFTLTGIMVEDLLLTGSDSIDGVGNHLDNRIVGNAGVNILDGGEGNDTLVGSTADELIGGDGDDLFVVSSDDISIIEQGTAGSGSDTIEASVSFDLGITLNVENLTLTGTAAINGTGDNSANVITGNDAGNILDGRGGADVLSGGKGNDIYVIDVSDTIVEAEDGGTDTIEITAVYAQTEYTLDEFFENLTLRGSGTLNGTGNAANNVITGNSGRNMLSGLDGSDVLDGGAGADRLSGDAGEDTLIGGAGDDVLIGGAGNDLYLVDSASDIVTEEANGGTFDRVIAKVSHTLAANIEYLALENAGGNINGTGNNLDNTIFGNSGNNVLDGGAGRDQLYGATGNDTVQGGDGDDTIHESGDGFDVLNGGAGNDDIRAESGNDVLDGGTGADLLKGGLGDDTYMVDNALDMITETDGEDIDRVTASTSFSLAAGAAVEHLAAAAGGSTLNLTGNEFANAVTGNDGANRLAGGAGDDILDGGAGHDRLYGSLGKDTLKGGAGKDIFVFDTSVDRTRTQIDKVLDYKVKDDSLWLDNAVFTKLGKKGSETKPAKLNAAFFTIGTKAKDKNDYLIYNNKTGKLYYDGDGSGSKMKAVEIATLSKKLALTAAEFFVI